MNAAGTLTVARGPIKGRRFVFDKPATITVGRAGDCDVCIPSHDDYMDVSRHHGWFEIYPPSLQVFDSGSLNGTYVNGVNVSGTALPSWNGDVSADMAISALHDGDEVRMGNLVFEVGVCTPTISAIRDLREELGVRACMDTAV